MKREAQPTLSIEGQYALDYKELCTLTRKQVHLSKRSGTLRIIGKRNKERSVPLNATARSILGTYLENTARGEFVSFPLREDRRCPHGASTGTPHRQIREASAPRRCESA